MEVRWASGAETLECATAVSHWFLFPHVLAAGDYVPNLPDWRHFLASCVASAAQNPAALLTVPSPGSPPRRAQWPQTLSRSSELVS